MTWIEAPAEARPASAGSDASEPTQRREPWLALSAIVVLGGVSGAAYYLGFVAPYRLDVYYLTPLLDLAKLSGHTGEAANSWALTWIILFASYYVAFTLLPASAGLSRAFRWTALGIIGGFALLFCANLLFMYPVGAADIFDHIFHARMTVHYGLNPFIDLPNMLPKDPFLPYTAWKGEPSHYGPLWEVLAAATYKLSGDSLWNNLIGFKLLVTLFYGVSAVLSYLVLRARKPEWALKGTLFFAWNPLVLFEVPGNGHHESVVAAFMLAGIYFLVTARRLAVLPALVAGALTKFVPLLLVPVAMAALWRDRLSFPGRSRRLTDDKEETAPVTASLALQTLVTGSLLSVALTLVLYIPFWEGTASIGALYMGPLFTASIPKVALDLLMNDLGVPWADAQSMVRYASLGLVGLLGLVLTARVFFKGNARTPGSREALVDAALKAFYELMFFYLALATFWFQPWYLVWLVALAVPLASATHVKRTLLFCLGGVANYFVWDFIWLWSHADIRTIQITSAIAIYTLPLLYTIYVWIRPRRARDEALA